MVTHNVAARPVCQIGTLCDANQASGPATAAARVAQNNASRPAAVRNACTSAGTMLARAMTLSHIRSSSRYPSYGAG